jgi:hypothetical protein|tara:strand:- start:39 stop:413 length:375 start_codon:yes stop_codon:yes gene_type:complete
MLLSNSFLLVKEMSVAFLYHRSRWPRSDARRPASRHVTNLNNLTAGLGLADWYKPFLVQFAIFPAEMRASAEVAAALPTTGGFFVDQNLKKSFARGAWGPGRLREGQGCPCGRLRNRLLEVPVV